MQPFQSLTGLVLGLALTLNAIAAPPDSPTTASRGQKEKNFSSINVSTFGTVRFRQAPKCSMSIYGSEKMAEKVRTRLEHDELIIDYDDNRIENLGQGDELHIEITAPTLKSIVFNGVGEFSCDSTIRIDNKLIIKVNGVGDFTVEDLHCKSLDVEINGVGKSWINVQCQQHLNAEVKGIGMLTLRGRTATLSAETNGIGLISKRRLKVGQ